MTAPKQLYQVPQLYGPRALFRSCHCSCPKKFTPKACSWISLKIGTLTSRQTLSNFVSAEQRVRSPPFHCTWWPRSIFATLLGQRNSSPPKKSFTPKTPVWPQYVCLNLTRLHRWQAVYLNHSDNLIEQHYVCRWKWYKSTRGSKSCSCVTEMRVAS